ncbi:early nodulin-like protein 18 [Alnus glutinosa]|uniref:early nodulin-like protein 18 n=1 Tax=Alnus glutinosa TaxID=3517 RepID=UPI002D795BF6|nr:early nodulin-like protein 18 [Alnus glutinosa]
MEQRSYSVGLLFFILSCSILLSFSGSVEAYKNYTVGDALGWYDKLEKPSVNYQKWVAGKNFSLGDFLIFNTDNNHSVVQTYNLTTYKLCDYDNAQENDTTQWSVSDPSASSPHPDSVAVPLLKEGMTYFFSGDYDGEQCKNGQRFKINVTHGQGLPESLKSPSEESPGPISPNAGDDESTPDTVVPSNFDHPLDQSDDKQASGSVSLSTYWQLMDRTINGILVLLGLVCLL